MATPAEVLGWRPELLDEAARVLMGRRTTLLGLQDEIDAGALPAEWSGHDASAARRNHRVLRNELNDLTAEVSAAIRALWQACEGAGNAQRVLTGAIDLAYLNQFSVDPASGLVVDAGGATVGFEATDRARLLAEIAGQIEQGRRAADHTDLELAAVLDRIASGWIDGGRRSLIDAMIRGGDDGTRKPAAPPVGDGPGEQYGWWTGLTRQERFRVIDRQPELIGNTPGIPFWARHKANLGLLPRLRAELEAQVQQRPPRPQVVDLGALLRWEDEYGHVDNVLAGLDRIEALLARHPGQRQLITLDATGAHQLRAAIGIGDVDHADHVSVLTPGLGSSVADSLTRLDDDMSRLVHEAREFSQANNDSDTHAAIVWLGYEAPQLDRSLVDPDRSVANPHLARIGADDLAEFYNGIDAARPDDPHLTAVGHSYGSTTVGLAAQQSTGFDDVVVYGSPGLGTDRVEDLDVPGDSMFYLEADGDVVGDLGWFGHDPTYVDGIRDLDTAAHPEHGLAGISGHTSYLTEDSTSQHNIAAVVSGHREQLIDDTRGPSWSDKFREGLHRTHGFADDRLEDGKDLLGSTLDHLNPLD